ncbi:MAG: hypothetical protein ACOCQR_00070 [bacterium]
MDVRLQTDFIDYYDHWFDLDGLIFNRYSVMGIDRPAMFSFFSNNGIPTPTFGIVKNISLQNFIQKTNNIFLVIYLDHKAHQGKNKIKVSFQEAYVNYKNFFFSEFLPPVNFPAVATSYRFLKVGSRSFWLSYSSQNWRSNYGDVRIKLFNKSDLFNFKIQTTTSIEKIKEILLKTPYPLLAVDFILFNNVLYAVDFNISPQVKGTGVEKILPAKEVVNLIKVFLKKNI